MMKAAEVIEANQSVFDDCNRLLEHPKFAAEIGPQFDRDTLDQPMVPNVIDRIVACSPQKMRRKLIKQLQGRVLNPLRKRKAVELWKEKRLRASDPNRKRNTRAWYRRHASAGLDLTGCSDTRHPWESSRSNRLLEILQVIKAQLRDKQGFVSLEPHEAIPLAGRVILLASLVADPAASNWTPRLTVWQGIPWDFQRDGERLDGRLWLEAEPVEDHIVETRFLLRKLMFEGSDWHVQQNLDLTKNAVDTWKRLIPQTPTTRAPQTPVNPPDAATGRVVSVEPLTDIERAVYELIKCQPAGEGIQGRQILGQLMNRHQLDCSDSHLYRQILPRLKRDFHVKNRRGVGYYIPQ